MEEPEFEEKGEFKFPSQDLTNMFFMNGPLPGDGRLKSAHLIQEYAFVYCQPFFVVWNWVKGTAARWDVDDPLEKVIFCPIVVVLAAADTRLDLRLRPSYHDLRCKGSFRRLRYALVAETGAPRQLQPDAISPAQPKRFFRAAVAYSQAYNICWYPYVATAAQHQPIPMPPDGWKPHGQASRYVSVFH